MLVSVLQWEYHIHYCKKKQILSQKVEEDGILYALEELGLIDKELQFPQLDLPNHKGPKATIKQTMAI